MLRFKTLVSLFLNRARNRRTGIPGRVEGSQPKSRLTAEVEDEFPRLVALGHKLLAQRKQQRLCSSLFRKRDPESSNLAFRERDAPRRYAVSRLDEPVIVLAGSQREKNRDLTRRIKGCVFRQ